MINLIQKNRAKFNNLMRDNVLLSQKTRDLNFAIEKNEEFIGKFFIKFYIYNSITIFN